MSTKLFQLWRTYLEGKVPRSVQELYRRHQAALTSFSLIGALVFVFGVGGLYFEVHWLHLGQQAAFFLQGFLSIETSFFLNWRLTWRKRQSRFRVSFWRFHLMRVVTIPVNQAIYFVLIKLGMEYLVAALATTAIFTAINYVVCHFWAFPARLSAMGPEESRPDTSDVTNNQDPQDGGTIHTLPFVSVVIPVKGSLGSGRTIRATVSSLLNQEYGGRTEVILVGDINDPTWEALGDLQSDPRIRTLEVDASGPGRDANVKRTTGLSNAKGEIFALTDSDTIPPQDWIATGVSEMLSGEWQCVGGGVYSLGSDFWCRYMDHNVFGAKTLRVPKPYTLDASTFGGRGCKPPTTANAFITRAVFEAVGGPDVSMKRSYEDYEWFYRIAKEGFGIRFAPALTCGHDHGKGFRGVVREYMRGGQGCSDFIVRHRDSMFARRRSRQSLLVLASAASMVAIAVIVTALGSSADLVGGGAASGAAIVLGSVEVRKNKRPEAFFYPFLTLFLGSIFTLGIFHGLHIKRGTSSLPGKEGMMSSPSSAKRKRRKFASRESISLIGVLGIAALLRFWNINNRPGFIWDETAYSAIARNLLSGGRLASRPDYADHVSTFFYQPPFYFWELAGWDKLVGQTGIAAARWLAAATSLVALLLLWAFMRRAIGSRPALVTAGLLATDSWMIYANRIGWMENTAIVFVTAAMWLYWRAVQRPTPGQFILAGAAAGMAVVFKHTDAYVLLAAAISWLIFRKYHRHHIQFFATALTIVTGYLLVMTLLNPAYGQFWGEMGQQVQRTFGNATGARRGSINSTGQLIGPLFDQYRIFVGSILVATSGVTVMAVRWVQCLMRRSFQPVRDNQVLFAWATAAVIGFGAIKLRYPSYFELVLVPLYVYLAAEVTGWLRGTTARRRLVPMVAVVLIGALNLGGFWWRIVDHKDNAIGVAATLAQEYVPTQDVVLTEVTIGNEISQPWCDIQWQTTQCAGKVRWIMTYTSDTNSLSSLDAPTQALLARSTKVETAVGFEGQVTLWRVSSAP